MPRIKTTYDSDKNVFYLDDGYSRSVPVRPEAYGYSWNGPRDAAGYPIVVVPPGFETDGLSRPWYLAFLIDRIGTAFPAAVLHDYIYTNHPAGRPWADEVFDATMKMDGMTWLGRKIRWAAVRLCGRSHWDPA